MMTDSAAAENPAETPALSAEKTGFEANGLSRALVEAWEYSRFLLHARFNRAKVTARDTVTAIVLGVLIFFVVSGVLLIATTFLLYGVAQGLGEWIGRPWTGYLISGALLLFAAVAYIRIQLKILPRRAFKERMQDYEEQLQKQRAAFGRDIEERAAQNGT